jgi:hypothetical protein
MCLRQDAPGTARDNALHPGLGAWDEMLATDHVAE